MQLFGKFKDKAEGVFWCGRLVERTKVNNDALGTR